MVGREESARLLLVGLRGEDRGDECRDCNGDAEEIDGRSLGCPYGCRYWKEDARDNDGGDDAGVGEHSSSLISLLT